MGAEKPAGRKGIMLYTVCIYTGMWVLASVHAAIGALQTEVIDYFSLRDSVKGLPSSVVSGFSIVAFLCVLFTAGMFRKSRILALGLGIGASALCLIIIPAPFSVFIALLCVVGLSTGVIDSLSSAVISELYPGKGSTMCLLHATYGCAGLAMPFLFKWALDSGNLSWRAAYLIIGLFMAALFATEISVSRRFSPVIEPRVKARKSVTLRALLRVMSDKRLLPIYVSAFLGGVYLNTMLVWTPRFIEFGHGGARYLSWVLACVYLAITAARLAMSALKPDMLRFLKCGMPVTAAALVGAILVKPPVIALALLFVSVFFDSPVIPFHLTIAGGIMPEDRFVVTVSLMFTMMLGQTVASPLIGKAESLWGINNAMYIAAAAMLGAWLAALMIRKNTDNT